MSPAGHYRADSTFRGSQGKSVSGRSFADSPSYSGAMWGGHAQEQLQGRGCHRTVSPTITTIPSASPRQCGSPPRLRQAAPGRSGLASSAADRKCKSSAWKPRLLPARSPAW